MLALRQAGMTLLEILIASTAAVAMVLAVTTLETGRLRMERELRGRSALESEQAQAALTVSAHLAKSLERADRLNIRDTGIPGEPPFSGPPGEADVQVRTFEPRTNCGGGGGCAAGSIPDPCCFDEEANYVWHQYRRTGAELRLYSDTAAGCGSLRVLARDITDFGIAFKDEAGAPPGGEPGIDAAPGDNNVVAYSLTWDDGTRSHTFTGQVTSRAIAYTDLGASGGDSGAGLAPPGLSDPPAGCS